MDIIDLSLRNSLGNRPNAPKPAASSGLEVELQTNGTYIQWRYRGFAKWNNLIAIKDLKGDKGEKGDRGQPGEQGAPGLKGEKGEQGFRGATGATGLRGMPGEQGERGEAGTDGKDGADGREIELQKSSTHIQWRFAGDELWNDLIALSELRGEKGEKGDKGDPGERGAKGDRGPMGMPGPQGRRGLPGPAGTGGGGAASLKAYQRPLESPNGSRKTFTVPDAYAAGSLVVMLNGLVELYVSEQTSTTFSFEDAPLSSDIIFLNYAVL